MWWLRYQRDRALAFIWRCWRKAKKLSERFYVPRIILAISFVDRDELMNAVNGWRWKLVASELDEWLKREIKYKDKEEFQEVRDELRELISDRGLSLWQ